MRFALPLAFIVVLAACAPAVTRFDPAEGTRVFSLTIDGQAVPSAGGAFTYRSEPFDLDVTLRRDRLDIDLVNNTAATMRLIPDRSAIVLPDGSSSNVVTGTVSWTTRNDPQPTIVIPETAKASEVLLARSLLGFSSYSGLFIEPMFSWPLSSRVTIRLVLALEVEGSEREVTLVFEGTPPPQPNP